MGDRDIDTVEGGIVRGNEVDFITVHVAVFDISVSSQDIVMY